MLGKLAFEKYCQFGRLYMLHFERSLYWVAFCIFGIAVLGNKTGLPRTSKTTSHLMASYFLSARLLSTFDFVPADKLISSVFSYFLAFQLSYPLDRRSPFPPARFGYSSGRRCKSGPSYMCPGIKKLDAPPPCQASNAKVRHYGPR